MIWQKPLYLLEAISVLPFGKVTGSHLQIKIFLTILVQFLCQMAYWAVRAIHPLQFSSMDQVLRNSNRCPTSKNRKVNIVLHFLLLVHRCQCKILTTTTLRLLMAICMTTLIKCIMDHQAINHPDLCIVHPKELLILEVNDYQMARIIQRRHYTYPLISHLIITS